MVDEVGHLPAGWSHWELKRFDLYNVNPPLVRCVGTLPVYLLGEQIDLPGYPDGPARRAEFDIGRRWIREQPDRFQWSFTIARWACIPFSLLGAWVCYRWATDLYGAAAGLTALLLWCFSPTVLGHASLLTPDAPAASMGAAACYAFWRWLREPSIKWTLWAGILLGLTQLCKLTWMFLYGLWPCVWLLNVVWKRFTKGDPDNGPVVRRECGQLVLMLFVSLWVLNNGYLFEDSGQPLGSFRFFSQALGGPSAQPGNTEGSNRFVGTMLEHLPMPVPRNYIQGIDRVKFEYERGYPSYLRGVKREGGWWYYYLYAMLVKMPVGTLVLLGLSTGSLLAARRKPSGDGDVECQTDRAAGAAAVRESAPRPRLKDELFLLAPAVGVIALVSSQTGFNHHLRYVLPAFPFLFIFASGAVSMRGVGVASDDPEGVAKADETRGSRKGVKAQSENRGRCLRFLCALASWRENCLPAAAQWRQMLCAVCVLATIISSLSIYPHSLSYFNEPSGGSINGWKHLDFSNVDWGQDLLLAKEWVDEHPHATPLYVQPSGFVSPADVGIVSTHPQPIRSAAADSNTNATSFPRGWYIIGLHRLVDPQQPVHEFLKRQPNDYIGYSMRVYHIP